MYRQWLVALSLLFALLPLDVEAQSELACDQISSQELAQWMFDRNPKMYPLLDEDGDGIACEDLPNGGPIGAGNAQAVPTATATPPPVTPTPTTDLTAQEEAYFDELSAELDHATDIAFGLQDLFSMVGNDVTVLFDDEWRLDMAAHLVEWQQFHVAAQGMNPSPRQQHIHNIWLESTNLMSLSADDIIDGIDNIDPAPIERGTARIVYATLLMDDLTAAIELFGADPNALFVPTHAVSPVQSCDAIPNYDEAQQYYAAYPSEQPVIDPDLDGVACEVYFGRG